jgi:hypothetical protein
LRRSRTAERRSFSCSKVIWFLVGGQQIFRKIIFLFFSFFAWQPTPEHGTMVYPPPPPRGGGEQEPCQPYTSTRWAAIYSPWSSNHLL